MPFTDTYPENLAPASADRIVLVHTNEDGSVAVQRTTVASLVGVSSIQNSVTAAVGGQNVAVQLIGQICTVTTVPPGGGGVLTAGPGQTQKVFNRCHTGQVFEVFPIAGMAIENNTTNAAVAIADGGAASFTNNGTIFLVS